MGGVPPRRRGRRSPRTRSRGCSLCAPPARPHAPSTPGQGRWLQIVTDGYTRSCPSARNDRTGGRWLHTIMPMLMWVHPQWPCLGMPPPLAQGETWPLPQGMKLVGPHSPREYEVSSTHSGLLQGLLCRISAPGQALASAPGYEASGTHSPRSSKLAALTVALFQVLPCLCQLPGLLLPLPLALLCGEGTASGCAGGASALRMELTPNHTSSAHAAYSPTGMAAHPNQLAVPH